MRLFELDENKQVLLNKVWIAMIPEFKALLTRDKGSKGDYRGDKKLKATKEFTYIYFYADFSSPIRDWEDEERKTEALYYAQLEEQDIDSVVLEAQEKYFSMQMEMSRPLRTLKSLYKGLHAMDRYFESINFAEKDKQGKLLNSPTDFVTNASKLNKMYDEIRNFEKRVEDDLKQTAGIRGPNSTLGDREGMRIKWSEEEIMSGSKHTAAEVLTSKSSFGSMIEFTKRMAEKEMLEEELEKKELNIDIKPERKVYIDDEEEDEL